MSRAKEERYEGPFWIKVSDSNGKMVMEGWFNAVEFGERAEVEERAEVGYEPRGMQGDRPEVIGIVRELHATTREKVGKRR
jgi:hypothetical protein